MSTEPSALAKAIHHGSSGAVSPSSNMCQRIEQAIREECIVTDKADLPEVTEAEGGFFEASHRYIARNQQALENARNNAASYLAIAEHIEAARSAEKVSAEKLTKRRDELAREFWHQQGVERYAQLSKDGAQLAVDHIIGLESPA